jgi:hypothetical protein
MLRVRPCSRNHYEFSNDYTDNIPLSLLPTTATPATLTTRTTNSVTLSISSTSNRQLSPSPHQPPEAPCPHVLGPAPSLPKSPSHTFHLGNNRSFVTTIAFPSVPVGRLDPSLISPSASLRNKTAIALSTPGTYRLQANHFSLAQASSQRVLYFPPRALGTPGALYSALRCLQLLISPTLWATIKTVTVVQIQDIHLFFNSIQIYRHHPSRCCTPFFVWKHSSVGFSPTSPSPSLQT